MTHGKSEKVRILVAFGDITGSGHFYDEVTDESAELDPFFYQYDKFIRQTQKKTGYLFHDLGDGYMCIADFHHGDDREKAARFLLAMWELRNQIQWAIKSKESPRPGAFRVAVGCGYVHRKMGWNNRWLFRGKRINETHGLLEVARQYGMVCHSSVKDIFSELQIRRHGFRFVETPQSHAWSFEIKTSRLGPR